MEYFAEIEQLKKKFSVGKKYAEKLLTESNGNLQQSENLFKNHLVDLFVQKQEVSIEIAVKFLEESNYDFVVALKFYEEDKYGKTGLCLRKNKNKEKALYEILNLIVSTQNIQYDYYWEIESLSHLSDTQRTFVLLMGWINVEDWEGDLIIKKEFANEWRNINVEWFADLFDEIIKREEELSKTNKRIWEDKLYKSFNDVFLKRREELINKLYNFVNENKVDFP